MAPRGRGSKYSRFTIDCPADVTPNETLWQVNMPQSYDYQGAVPLKQYTTTTYWYQAPKFLMLTSTITPYNLPPERTVFEPLIQGEIIQLCEKHHLTKDEPYKLWPDVFTARLDINPLLEPFGRPFLIDGFYAVLCEHRLLAGGEWPHEIIIRDEHGKHKTMHQWSEKNRIRREKKRGRSMLPMLTRSNIKYEPTTEFSPTTVHRGMISDGAMAFIEHQAKDRTTEDRQHWKSFRTFVKGHESWAPLQIVKENTGDMRGAKKPTPKRCHFPGECTMDYFIDDPENPWINIASVKHVLDAAGLLEDGDSGAQSSSHRPIRQSSAQPRRMALQGNTIKKQTIISLIRTPEAEEADVDGLSVDDESDSRSSPATFDPNASRTRQSGDSEMVEDGHDSIPEDLFRANCYGLERDYEYQLDELEREVDLRHEQLLAQDTREAEEDEIVAQQLKSQEARSITSTIEGEREETLRELHSAHRQARKLDLRRELREAGGPR